MFLNHKALYYISTFFMFMYCIGDTYLELLILATFFSPRIHSSGTFAGCRAFLRFLQVLTQSSFSIFAFFFLKPLTPKVIQYSVMGYKHSTCWSCVLGGKGWELLFFCCLVLCGNIPFCSGLGEMRPQQKKIIIHGSAICIIL